MAEIAFQPLVAAGLLYLFISLMAEDGFSWVLFGLSLLVLVSLSGPWTPEAQRQWRERH
jgi:hypothetical protein